MFARKFQPFQRDFVVTKVNEIHLQQTSYKPYLPYTGTCLVLVAFGPGLIVSAQILTLYCIPPRTSKLYLKVLLFVVCALAVTFSSRMYV